MIRGKAKFFQKDGGGLIYISKDVVSDSRFPFKDRDELIATILDDGRLMLEVRK